MYLYWAERRSVCTGCQWRWICPRSVWVTHCGVQLLPPSSCSNTQTHLFDKIVSFILCLCTFKCIMQFYPTGSLLRFILEIGKINPPLMSDGMWVMTFEWILWLNVFLFVCLIFLGGGKIKKMSLVVQIDCSDSIKRWMSHDSYESNEFVPAGNSGHIENQFWLFTSSIQTLVQNRQRTSAASILKLTDVW